MSNNSAADIRANVETQLNEVTELKEVKDSRTFSFTGYPACRFYLSAVENELITNVPGYLRRYTFTVEVIQETTNRNKTDAEGDLQNAVDAVMDKLGTEVLLDGNADHTTIESGSVDELETPQGPAIIAALTYTVQTFLC